MEDSGNLLIVIIDTNPVWWGKNALGKAQEVKCVKYFNIAHAECLDKGTSSLYATLQIRPLISFGQQNKSTCSSTRLALTFGAFR